MLNNTLTLLSAVMNTAATIRVPAHVFRLLNRWKQTEHWLGLVNGRPPSCEEVALEMGLNEQQKVLVIKALRARDLQQESFLLASSRPWSSSAMTDGHETPEALLEADEERIWLLQQLERLDARESEVLILRYGLGGEMPMNLQAIGLRLGLSKEWVRKVAEHAIRRLLDRPAADSDRIAERGARSRKDSKLKALQSGPDVVFTPSELESSGAASSSDAHPARHFPELGSNKLEQGGLALCG